MKKILLAFIGVFAFMSAAMAEEVTLKANTFVPVVLEETISSERLALGQDVNFSVATDIRASGKIVIEAGALVTATVTSLEEKGSIGAAGKIVISFLSVEAVDGTYVPLRGTKIFEGEDEVTSTVVVGVVLCPLALLNEGESAAAGEGVQARASVAQTIMINAE